MHDICHLLSGVPLAIELAAAWMDSFTLPELKEELGEQLELTARMSDLPERHRSLRTSLDWSWKLLDEGHRKMLMGVSTFRGGCFADAASAVLQMKGIKLRSGLAKLVDKSWLYTRDIGDKTRFYLRDAASREYTYGKLEGTKDGCSTVSEAEGSKATGTEAGATNQAISLYESSVMAHAKFYSELMGHEGGKLHGHRQLEAHKTFGLEKLNIFVAMDTLLHRLGTISLDSSPFPSSLEPSTLNLKPSSLLLPIVRWLWEFMDMTSDYRGLVERYLLLRDIAGLEGGNQQVLFWAHMGLCGGQWKLGKIDAAQSNTKKANALAEVLGDHYGHALALNNLGHVERNQGYFDAAQEFYKESLAIRGEIGDRYGIAESLHNLGTVEFIQGNYKAAKQLYKKSLSLRRELGNLNGIAESLTTWGF